MITTTKRYSELRLRDEQFTNPRTHSGLGIPEILELARSIYLHGVLVPLLVTDTCTIVAGQRRYLALGLLQSPPALRDIAGPNGDLQSTPTAFRVRELLANVPVRILSKGRDGEFLAQLEGIALTDNLLRSDLSSYEIAARLAQLAEQGLSGVAIANAISKSPTYVSRKLSAWRGAGVDLRSAWEAGELTDDQVQQLAELPHDMQAKALAGPVPRGRRGPAHRPSVDAVRDFLFELEEGEKAWGNRTPTPDSYRTGVMDALRWVTGANTGPAFVKLAGGGDS